MSTPQELFEKYMGNRLSNREKAVLTDLLREEPARAAFTRYVVDWTLMGEAIRQIQGVETERKRPASNPGARRLRMAWRPVLALAASLLIVAGIFVAQTRRGAGDWIADVRTVGQVETDGARFVVGPDSYCRIDLRDGSRLALAPGAAVVLARDMDSGAVMVAHEAGELYLDVAKRTEPFVVRSGTAAIDVLGTRLLLEPDKFLAVLNGRVHLDWKGFVTTVEAGQRAAYETEPGMSLPQLRVQRTPVRLSELAWLERLGMDPHAILAEAPMPAFVSDSGNRLDTESYILMGRGTWAFERRDTGVLTIRQSDAEGGNIAFGPRDRRRGTFSVRFRFLERADDDAAVGMGFHHELGADLFMVSKAIRPWVESFEWFAMRTHFQIGAGNTLGALLEIWPETRPDLKKEFRFLKTPANSPVTKKRDLCRVGLAALGCAVEFEEATLHPVAFTTASRIVMPSSPDLIAFYTFQKGSGTVVKDVSGIGEPMDMTIGRPENVAWLTDALRIEGPADISYVGPGNKMRDAWEKNGGLTFEFWVRSPETWDAETPLNGNFLCLTASGHYIWWQQGFKPSSANWGRDAIVFHDVDGRLRWRWLPSDDPADLVERLFERALALHASRTPIGVHLVPSFGDGTKNRVPWKGDLIALAIYGRPFSGEELLRAKVADRD